MDSHSIAWVTEASDEAIRASRGDVTFLRGRSYEASGHVLKYSTDRTGPIEAVAKGSRRKVYWTSLHHDHWGINSACSYPVRMGCKHVMVVLLAARESAVETVSPVFSWENALAGLLPTTETEGRPVEFGLEFRIDGSLEQPNGLVLHPLRFGKQDWIKSQAGWLDIVTNYRGVNYESAQRKVLSQTVRLAGRHQYTYSTPASVSPSDLGPLGCSFLSQGVDTGIQLIAGQGFQDMEIGFEPVRIRLDVDLRDDGLQQLAMSEDLGPAFPGSRRLLIGEPAHGAGGLGPGGRLRLRLLVGTVLGAIRGLLNQDLTVTIPAQDAGWFRLMYLPALVQRRFVPPGTWGPEDFPYPELTLGLTYEPGHRMLLEWGFRYVAGETIIDVVFHPRVGESFRDQEAEQILEEVALRLVGDYPNLREPH